MAEAFVQATNGLTVPLGSLRRYTTQNSFADFTTSPFPIFALSESGVSQHHLQQATQEINEQAQAELGFDDTELSELGYAAIVPKTWQLNTKGATKWYIESFLNDSSTSDNHWYPLGFLVVASSAWRQEGIVLVYLDA